MDTTNRWNLDLRSQSLRSDSYEIQGMTKEEIAFLDAVYALCEENYERGGDTIVECYAPAEVLEEFKDLEDVREFCGLKVEQALNAREGTDSDPQVETYSNFRRWSKERLRDVKNPRRLRYLTRVHRLHEVTADGVVDGETIVCEAEYQQTVVADEHRQDRWELVAWRNIIEYRPGEWYKRHRNQRKPLAGWALVIEGELPPGARNRPWEPTP